MTNRPADWARVREVFEGALRLPAELRPAHVAAACGDDQDLRVQVEGLLTSHEESNDFLGPRTAWATIESLTARLEGSRVGAYRILREIGRGGMGSVYLAERADGAFDQRVAIKVVNGIATDVLLRRFHAERRILAVLEHPNVARLLDGGTTSDGLPYLVMEYVDGVAIHQYCEQGGLTVRQRLGLFRQVCAAVQYAHQHLVIHRDIKAWNILVTPDGTPKLLDFGIATLVDPTARDGEQAPTLTRLMTPDSASPEQVRGDPITVSADIYALGVLLYRLLTGQSPYSSAPTTETALMRAICEEIPRPPAAVATGDGKHAIGRDLDRIVLKALRKEPERRYNTVLQFSDDVQRYLDGRPVVAAPDSVAYRSSMFVRRHWKPLVAAAVAVVAILGGAAIALTQAREARRERATAEQRFEMVRTLADSVVFDLNDALESLPGSLQARQLIVSKALGYLDQLGQQVGPDVSLTEQVAAAYLKIGDIQGNPYHPNVGDPGGAMTSYRRSLELYTRAEAQVHTRPLRLGIAAVREAIGDLDWSSGDFEHASGEYREERRVAEGLVADEPHRVESQRRLASAEYKIGQTQLRVADLDGAEISFHESVRTSEEALREHPDNIDVARVVALGYGKLGDVARERGSQRQALELFTKTVTLFETIAPRSSHGEDTHRLILFRLRVSGTLADLGRWTEAESAARRALDLVAPAIRAAEGDTQATSDVGYAYLTLGDALSGQRRDAEALDAYRTALNAYHSVLSANPRYIEDRRELGFTLAGIGDLALRSRHSPDALVSYHEAMAWLEAPEIRPQSIAVLASVYLRAGDAQERVDANVSNAIPWYKKSEAAWAELSKRRDLTPAQLILQEEAAKKAADSR